MIYVVSSCAQKNRNKFGMVEYRGSVVGRGRGETGGAVH